MRPRYAIRVDEHAVVVEHRAGLRWQTLALGTAGFIVFSFLDGVAEEALHPTVEWAWMAGITFLFYVPAMGLLSAFPLYARAEALHCDARELRLARRRLFRRWTRGRMEPRSVTGVRLVQHLGRQRRHYSSLVFNCGGKRVEMMEQISDADALRVIAGLQALGAGIYMAPEDTASAAMHADIAQRGWLVNPWKPD